MPEFLGDDFLLESDLATRLYHEVAAPLPIIDFHGHLPPAQMAADHRFRSITEIWLDGDHYKWRAMRANGVAERFCTGDATDWEKFEAWARTVPDTVRNPLYHWTHMELRRPFGIAERLSPATARTVFDRCNELLGGDGFSTLDLLARSRVAVVCTTDDPTDSLEPHRALAARKDPETQVFPTWRPDRALAVDDPVVFRAWLDALERASGLAVSSWTTFLEALETRHGVFHDLGCRASDHGLERIVADDVTDAEAAAAFERSLAGHVLDVHEVQRCRSALLHRLALLDHARGWVQQFHLGAMRNNNTRMRRILGPDTGFDSIGEFPQVGSLARFLDRLETTDQLAKTILYNLNPRDNEAFAALCGCFMDGATPGKVQYGAAWWFLDQLDGMRRQVDALSNLGLLSRFVGMITDSRSFLSFSRHEYFRRLFCNLLGEDVRRGFLPNDPGLLEPLVRNVCFLNARDFFGFRLGGAAGGLRTEDVVRPLAAVPASMP